MDVSKGVYSRRLCQVALAAIGRFKIREAATIVETLGAVERFFSMDQHSLAAALGFNNPVLSDKSRKEALEKAENELRFMESNAIRWLWFDDPDSGYPLRLAECPDAPCGLFMIGDCNLNNGKFLSVVGTRHATAYGVDTATNLVADLSASMSEPLTVVSGLAYGIDIAAHKAALDKNIPTVAVLAHGLKTIYPAAHRNYAASIVKHSGALLTEYFSDAAIHRGNFLARNRIVAGLADALVVVESQPKGGAMFTARLASEYNREVFAVPGRLTDKYSGGCNLLINRQMATAFTSADDLAQRLDWDISSDKHDDSPQLPLLDDNELAVVDLLREKGEARLAEILAGVGLPVYRLTPLLVDLEFREIVRSLPGGLYRLAKPI